MQGTSFSERKVSALFEQADITFEQEFSFPDLKSGKGNLLRFDFAVFDDEQSKEMRKPKFLLELQGEQHYTRKWQSAEQFSEQQSNDKRKKQYCGAKGYTLVAIPYTEFKTMTLDYILEQGKFFE